MREDQVRAIFLLAGIEVFGLDRMPNNYWPKVYKQMCNISPWWNVHTQWGVIYIGWRKRVISISWAETDVKYTTVRDVTKEEKLVHAYSYADAVDELSNWRQEAKRLPIE